MIKFGYFKVNTAAGTGYICIALDRPEKGNKKHTASFSFCSPKEKLFSKKRARTIAEGRFSKGLRVDFDYDGKNIIGAFIKAVNCAKAERWLPSWAIRNLKYGLDFGMKSSTNTTVVFDNGCARILEGLKPETIVLF